MSMMPFPAGLLLSSTGPLSGMNMLDSRHKTSTIALSGSNLVATKNATTGYANVLARYGKSSGAWRFQVTIDNAGTGEIGIGMGNLFTNMGTYLGGPDGNSFIYVNSGGSFGGRILKGNSDLSTTVPTFTTGDVIDVYCDLASVWFAKNGTLIEGSVALNTGGVGLAGITPAFYPAAMLQASNAQVTFNFGATPFTYPAVSGASGFTAWTAAEPYSLASYRRLGIRIRSDGFFGHGIAEFRPRAVTGGSSLATGGTAIERGHLSTFVAADMFDGNASTFWFDQPSGGVESQVPSWCGYDYGATASRTATLLALTARNGAGEAQGAPEDFIAMIGGATDWFKWTFHTKSWTDGETAEFPLAYT